MIPAICLKQPKGYCLEVTDVVQSAERRLENALSGAGATQAGRAGPTGQNRRGGGWGGLAGTIVLEQNVHAASAGGLSCYPHGRLALGILGSEVDPVLWRKDKPSLRGRSTLTD